MSEAYTLMRIPVRLVETVQGIASGSLVAVPREPMEELLRRWGAYTPLQQPFIGTAKEARKREAESREAGVRLLLAGAYLAYEVAAIRGAVAQEPGHE